MNSCPCACSLHTRDEIQLLGRRYGVLNQVSQRNTNCIKTYTSRAKNTQVITDSPDNAVWQEQEEGRRRRTMQLAGHPQPHTKSESCDNQLPSLPTCPATLLSRAQGGYVDLQHQEGCKEWNINSSPTHMTTLFTAVYLPLHLCPCRCCAT